MAATGIGDVAQPHVGQLAQDRCTGRFRVGERDNREHARIVNRQTHAFGASTRYWRVLVCVRVHQQRCAIGIKERSAMSWSPAIAHLFGDRDEGPGRADFEPDTFR